MRIDRAKFTAQYENGVIKSMWVGIEVSLDGGNGESPQAALDLSKQIADEWYKKNNPNVYNDNTMSFIQEDTNEPVIDAGVEIAKQFEKAKSDLAVIEFQEEAIKYLNNNGWTFNIELKAIANSKPKKQTEQ